MRGEYRVQLPDGRTQIVTYYADWQTGFHADVRYEGTAQYPDQYNTYNNNGISNQYGPPAYNTNNNYNNGYNNNGGYTNGGYNNGGYAGGGAPATSSVTIKDYSGNDNSNYNSGGYHY